MRVRIKICCISSLEEARLAVKYGAAALGLVSEMPSGPGVISEETIAGISSKLPPAVGSFLLTSRQSVHDIVDQQRRCRVNTVQICDRLENGHHLDLKNSMPGIAIVQVIHVRNKDSVREAVEISHHVDAILLDSGNQDLAVKELGGTGRVHDWALSAQIASESHVPVFLAGGLNAGNVADAIRAVKPFGVDVCSGVRSNGQLDEQKLAAFVRSVEGSFNS